MYRYVIENSSRCQFLRQENDALLNTKEIGWNSNYSIFEL